LKKKVFKPENPCPLIPQRIEIKNLSAMVGRYDIEGWEKRLLLFLKYQCASWGEAKKAHKETTFVVWRSWHENRGEIRKRLGRKLL
jgi:hypothetical protein